MLQRLNKWLKLIQLLRIEVVLSAIGDSWLVIFLATGVESERDRNPELLADAMMWPLALGAIVGAGLAVYGLALNDVVDAKRDQKLSPDRPIASGQIGSRTALILSVLGLVAALGAAVNLGKTSAMVCLVAAVMALVYNTTAKFIPPAGIIMLGLIRVLNMFVPNPWAEFVWPIWFAMSHVMICTTFAYVIEGRRPRFRNWDWWVLCVGWLVLTLLLVSRMAWRNPGSPGLLHDRPRLWLWPLLAAGLLAIVSTYMMRQTMARTKSRRWAGRTFLRFSMLWMVLYDAAWLAGARVWSGAATLLALFLVGGSLLWLLGVLGKWVEPSAKYKISLDAN